MTDVLDLEEIKRRGAGRLAPEAVAVLYHEAFRTFGAQSLWSRKPSAQPTIAQAMVIAESLRREGNMKTRSFAVLIEKACRAAV